MNASPHPQSYVQHQTERIQEVSHNEIYLTTIVSFYFYHFYSSAFWSEVESFKMRDTNNHKFIKYIALAHKSRHSTISFPGVLACLFLFYLIHTARCLLIENIFIFRLLIIRKNGISQYGVGANIILKGKETHVNDF